MEQFYQKRLTEKLLFISSLPDSVFSVTFREFGKTPQRTPTGLSVCINSSSCQTVFVPDSSWARTKTSKNQRPCPFLWREELSIGRSIIILCRCGSSCQTEFVPDSSWAWTQSCKHPPALSVCIFIGMLSSNLISQELKEYGIRNQKYHTHFHNQKHVHSNLLLYVYYILICTLYPCRSRIVVLCCPYHRVFKERLWYPLLALHLIPRRW